MGLGCCEYAPAQGYVDIEEILVNAVKKTDKEPFDFEPSCADEPETNLEKTIIAGALRRWDAYKSECLIDTVVVKVYWTGYELKYRIDYIDSEQGATFKQLEDMGYRFKYNIAEPDSSGCLYRDIFVREPTLSGFMEYLRKVK
jgi:hypothetical protein